jgi:hypothetical protein
VVAAADEAAAAARRAGGGSGSRDEGEGGGAGEEECEQGSEEDEPARYSPLPSSPTKRAVAAAEASGEASAAPAAAGAPSSPAGQPTDAGGAGCAGGAAAGGSALLPGIFARPRRALRPLLPIPVNPRRRDEPCAALTVACNGCISQMEDFFEPWRALPRGDDADRFALVFEAQALKVGSWGAMVRGSNPPRLCF